jgi:peptidoglycan-N-acetylglucosamine deacetylase
MSRLARTTLATLIVACIAWALFRGWDRFWVVGTIWTLYVLVVAAGVTFIQLQFFCPAICRAIGAGNKVALTFDDGPNPALTPALLDLLKQEKISAAFFCIGKHVEAHPAIAARIVAEGHLIANHTFRHKWWTVCMRRTRLTRELTQTQSAIESASGITPKFMRPPIGLTNPHYAGVLKTMGMTMIGWTVRSLESVYSAEKVIRRIRTQTGPGSIILLHDGAKDPDRLLRIVSVAIKEIRAKGLEFDRLDKMLEPA